MTMIGNRPPSLSRRLGWLRRVLYVGAALLLWTPAFIYAAEPPAPSMTGIPIEWLFGSIATLVSVVYFDMKHSMRSISRELDKLRKAGERRQRNLIRISTKLNIPLLYPDDESPYEDPHHEQ